MMSEFVYISPYGSQSVIVWPLRNYCPYKIFMHEMTVVDTLFFLPLWKILVVGGFFWVPPLLNTKTQGGFTGKNK